MRSFPLGGSRAAHFVSRQAFSESTLQQEVPFNPALSCRAVILAITAAARLDGKISPLHGGLSHGAS